MKHLINKLILLINITHKIDPKLSLEEILESEKKYKKECKCAKYFHLSASPLYLIISLLTNSISALNIIIGTFSAILNIIFTAKYYLHQKATESRIIKIQGLIEDKKYDYLAKYIKEPSPQIVATINKLNNEVLFELDPEIHTFIQNSITSNVFTATQDFGEIFDYLNNANLNDEELLNIICHIYCKNYELFNGELCDIFLEEKHFNPSKSKYFHICEQVNLAKNIINDGLIIPNNITYEEETKNILTLDGFLNIPNNLLKMIIDKSNNSYRKTARKENKRKIKQEKLKLLLEKINNNCDITEQDIINLKVLLQDLDYEKDEAQRLINLFTIKYDESQTKKQSAKRENELKTNLAKQDALNNLYLLLKVTDNSFEPYKVLNDFEIEIIKSSLTTIGYTKDKIDLIISKIIKFNESVNKLEEENKLLTFKSKIFQKISEEELDTYTDNIENLYTYAIKFINDNSSDITLKFYKDKLIDLINKIDFYIYNLLNTSSQNDLNELKFLFLEIDNCFNDMYNINPLIRQRLTQND